MDSDTPKWIFGGGAKSAPPPEPSRIQYAGADRVKTEPTFACSNGTPTKIRSQVLLGGNKTHAEEMMGPRKKEHF